MCASTAVTLKEVKAVKIVVKVGGRLLSVEEQALPQAVKELKEGGARVVVVHGGGPQLTEVMERMGKKPQFVEGLRVTPPEEMDVIEMVLSGLLNKMLVGAFLRSGVPACGISGRDAFFLEGERHILKRGAEEIDLGRVGSIKRVSPKILWALWESGFVPVVSPVCGDSKWHALNVNADWVAAHVACALQADFLVLFSDVPGVLKDPKDPQSLIEVLRVQEIEGLVAEGKVSGGMIPKLRFMAEVLESGVGEVLISEGSEVVHLPRLLRGERFRGTRIVL